MNRRALLRGLTGFLVAPAIVRVASLMPVSTAALGDAELMAPWKVTERYAGVWLSTEWVEAFLRDRSAVVSITPTHMLVRAEDYDDAMRVIDIFA